MERLLHELTRVMMVLITAPLWYPVIKALWQEANKSLRRDGGVLGAPPDARKLREIEREERFEEPSLVNVPLDRRYPGGKPRAPRTSTGGRGRATPVRAAGRTPGRRAGGGGGFR